MLSSALWVCFPRIREREKWGDFYSNWFGRAPWVLAGPPRAVDVACGDSVFTAVLLGSPVEFSVHGLPAAGPL